MIEAMTNEATTLQPLSEWHLETLSPNATKLYTAVWLRMSSKSATEIWFDDAEASRRSRVLIQFITKAQSELVSAGLLRITPGARQVRYEFVDDPDSETVEAEV